MARKSDDEQEVTASRRATARKVEMSDGEADGWRMATARDDGDRDGATAATRVSNSDDEKSEKGERR